MTPDARAQWIEALGEQLDIAHESGNFSMRDLAAIAAEWAEALLELRDEQREDGALRSEPLPWAEAAEAMAREEKP